MSFRAIVQPLGTAIPDAPKNTVEYQLELVKLIKNQLKQVKNSEYIGEEKGKTIFAAQIEHSSFLTELQEFAASIDETNIEEIYKGNQQTRFNHLIEIRNNVGIYLPVFFFFPMRIALRNDALPIFVGSTPKLYTELQELATSLKPQDKLELNITSDSFVAAEEDLEDYEATYEGMQHFWPIFSFVVLENLVKKSLQNKLPIILWSL